MTALMLGRAIAATMNAIIAIVGKLIETAALIYLRCHKIKIWNLGLLASGVLNVYGKNKLRGYDHNRRQDYIPSEYLFTDERSLFSENSSCEIVFSLDTQVVYIVALVNMRADIESVVNMKFQYPKCHKIDPELVKAIVLFVSSIGFLIILVTTVVLIRYVFCKHSRQERKRLDALNVLGKTFPNRKYWQVMNFFEFMNGSDKKLVECTICLQRFSKDDIVKVLFCLHFFHAKCIMNWIKENTLCPLCKYQLDKQESTEICIDSKKFKYVDTIGNRKFMASIKLCPKDSDTLNELNTSQNELHSSQNNTRTNNSGIYLNDENISRKNIKAVQVIHT
jgi:hypothetical protein